MITISITLTFLIGRISAHVEPIAIIAAIGLMSIGIYLTAGFYLLGKIAPDTH